MHRLYSNLTREEAETYGLVLSAAKLTRFKIVPASDGWSIWVAEPLRHQARQHIESYSRENPVVSESRTVESSLSGPEASAAGKTYSALWVALVLSTAYFAAGSGVAFEKIAAQCGASAREILNGELYRTATALMLHASPAHLAGNIAGIALFGTAVCNIAGSGFGWLLILVSGIIGNLANAALIQSDHLSVGASTAVFGAVGLLSAIQFYRRKNSETDRLKAWVPLAGGLALLGFLGTGPYTDLTAHLFGFAAGILIGLASARFLKSQLQIAYQITWSLAAAGLVGGSWFWACLMR